MDPDGTLADSGGVMHEYRRFVQAELDARGWGMAELVRRSGLRRQLIWKILNDTRESLGQMPEDATLAGIAHGFGIPVERVRTAAARSLAGYIDDGSPLVTDISSLPTDVLIEELRRRATQADPRPPCDQPKPKLSPREDRPGL